MELKITPNKWYQSHREIPNDEDGMYSTQVYTGDGEIIATVSWYPKPKVNGVTGTYREDNAILIADAGNTTNSCGLLPSELLKQRDEMLEALKRIRKIADNTSTNPDFIAIWNQAELAIKQATEQKL